MDVNVIFEAGYDEALEGLALSYATPGSTFDRERMEKVAHRLAHRDGGHNKFLESIVVWVDITAPRKWWSQMDTYRVDVTKQSESTMHTLAKHPPMRSQFDDDTPWGTFALFWCQWWLLRGNINRLKSALPEGFMQRRRCRISYKTLRHIVMQRKWHRLSGWDSFIHQITVQIERPKLITKGWV